ncbi:hypothetical protein AQUCO_06800016v1 [Aquilegia coerulea]|uniref:Uncharacterized protein n=1 Tax=Aquilegia coerulea TaxID=218851 RepID=A0A2G5CCH9_AQUCA|nr:hypothetical protein AQUCO_06800016v1 [Aquilegia coerulea]
MVNEPLDPLLVCGTEIGGFEPPSILCLILDHIEDCRAILKGEKEVRTKGRTSHSHLQTPCAASHQHYKQKLSSLTDSKTCNLARQSSNYQQ